MEKYRYSASRSDGFLHASAPVAAQFLVITVELNDRWSTDSAHERGVELGPLEAPGLFASRLVRGAVVPVVLRWCC